MHFRFPPDFLAKCPDAAILQAMKPLTALALGVILCPWTQAATPAKAEPFEDALREAVKQYRSGKLEETRAALDQASKLLEQKRSGKVASTFPDPPEGWTAGEVEKAEIPALLGGGRTVKKTFNEKAGRKEVLVEVIYDSSLGQLLAGVASNDAIAESQGYKVRRIGNDPALLKEAPTGSELVLPVDASVMVKLTGKGGAAEKELLAIARGIDRRALRDAK